MANDQAVYIRLSRKAKQVLEDLSDRYNLPYSKLISMILLGQIDVNSKIFKEVQAAAEQAAKDGES